MVSWMVSGAAVPIPGPFIVEAFQKMYDSRILRVLVPLKKGTPLDTPDFDSEPFEGGLRGHVKTPNKPKPYLNPKP